MKRPDKSQAITRLTKQFHQIPALRRLSEDSSKFQKWHRDSRIAIANTFGEKSDHLTEFGNVQYSPGIYYPEMPPSRFLEAYVTGLETAAVMLESMIDEIKEYWEPHDPPRGFELGDKEPARTKKIFVVHGHDQSARASVARLLENQGLQPIVLHEQANKGRTIIEKFEDYGDVNFAVVLLTPDDEGRGMQTQSDMKLRARQNVVFEFGYFVGKLGRKQVCALVKGEIEQPSDCDGILYIPWDEGNGWKLNLLRELKAAGFEVDANQAL